MSTIQPQRKFDSAAAFYASLGRCPRIDRDDAAVVKEYIGSLVSRSRCLAEEFNASEAFDLFGIDGTLYERNPSTCMRESPVMFDTSPNGPPPPPTYKLPAMPIPDVQPKRPGQVRSNPVLKTPPPRIPALESEYTREAMSAIREFLIPKWIKDGKSEKEICDALRSAWPAQVIDPVIKEFFPLKEWPFTHA